MPLKWERLRLLIDQGPALLFNFTSSSNGYQLYITDLTYIWSEQSNRKAILKRADEQNTTIDPSEDPEQFKVLLQKIEEALRGSPGSSISLNNGNGRNTESLQLVVTTKLPAPLKPLKWSLYLSKDPNSSSTRHLLLPLLQETAGYESRERALLDQIKHKDWVLGKLFDKVETMGIDLATVFPGISGLRAGAGKKGTTLAQAGKYIKGVAPFDEKAFAKETSRSPGSGLAANLVAEYGSGSAEGISPAEDKWWDSLPAQGSVPAAHEEEVEKRPEEAKPSASSHDDMKVDTDGDQEMEGEDEFERQETPPRMKQSKDIEISPPSKGETRQEPRKPSPTPSSQKPTGKPSKDIGKIGGSKPTKKPSSPQGSETPTPTPSPEPEKEPERPAPAPSKKEEDLETASESEQPAEPAKLKEPTKQKKPGLGVIGGKKKTKAPSPELSPSPPPASAQTLGPSPDQKFPETATSPTPPPKRTSKLGVIGGKRKLAPEKAPEPPSEPTDSGKEPTTAAGPSPTKRPTKIGVIGGKSKPKSKQQPKAESSTERKEPSPATGPAEEEDGGDMSPYPSQAEKKSAAGAERKAEADVKAEREAEGEKEETEQEKADRKRGELKRMLEVKSKAPVKKKRKF